MSDVVILGGGFGGARAAISAAGSLGDEHTVTLIDRNRVTYLCGANPYLVTGEREPVAISRDLGDLGQHGVDFIEAEITGIDADARTVTSTVGTHPFDYLVVGLGAAYDWDHVPGSAAAQSFYNLSSALDLRAALERFHGGSIVIGVADAPIKCPPAPFEMAMMIHWHLERSGLRSGAEIHVAIPEPAPLGVAGPEASARLRSHLDRRGIELHTSAAVTRVDGDGSMALADGTTLPAAIPITVPRHRLPDVLAGLAGNDRWIPVDQATLETNLPGVFAIGDNNQVPVGDKAIPKAGVFAAGQGRTVAAVISSRILGTESPPPYDGLGHCFIAFSGEEAAQVGGHFLASGGPDVGLEEPSVDRAVAKEDFEARWRNFTM